MCSPDTGSRTVYSTGLKCGQQVGSTQGRTHRHALSLSVPLALSQCGSKIRAEHTPERKCSQNSMESTPHQESSGCWDADKLEKFR